MNIHHSEMSTPDRATVNRADKKELKSDFTVVLQQKILTGGYLPLAQYMRECLGNPDFGYYSTKKQVIGGERADFITAAEIPFFADILTGFVLDTWQKMGTPRKFHLVELGPGKGTLMQGILRQIMHVQPQLLNFIQVHMVEMGAARQTEQKSALKDFQTAAGRIRWHLSLDALPAFKGEASLFVCNEWFDALPISAYAFTERGWVETLVDVDDDPSHEAHFKFVGSPSGSFASFLMPDEIRLRTDTPMGETVEVCTHGMAAMETLARKMIESGKSAALIVDYGKDEHMKDTLRGIRGHKFVHPLLSPGDIDLSAWVSFKQLRWALERLPLAQQHLAIHGPMTQQDFLAWNGMDVRLASAIRDQETKMAMRMMQNFRRLMDDDEMGKSYKVFAVQTKNFATVAPWF